MKQGILWITVLTMAFSLGRCSDDDSWKKEYGTPDLFLQTVVNGNYKPNIYRYEHENQTRDEGLEVAQRIAASGPFKESQKKDTTAERYFTYEAFWQAATSGPNYCTMSIWEDGYLAINHKRSLGSLQSVYYSLDASKAAAVVDFAFQKIAESIETSLASSSCIRPFSIGPIKSKIMGQ